MVVWELEAAAGCEACAAGWVFCTLAGWVSGVAASVLSCDRAAWRRWDEASLRSRLDSRFS
jgi:hypothetical protein